MKKFLFLFFVLNVVFVYSQKQQLNIKFEEKDFLTNIIIHKTSNPFILRVFDEANNSGKKESTNYISILDSLLKKEFKESAYDDKTLTKVQKREYDSLRTEIYKGNLSKLLKQVIEVNFDEIFLKNALINNGIKNIEVSKTDYNLYNIVLNSYSEKKQAEEILSKNNLSFHESFDENELKIFQDCFMKENKLLVKNNYLKVENDYFLIYNQDQELFNENYSKSKCFQGKNIKLLNKKGTDYDVFNKLFIAKESDSLENLISKSIRGFDVAFEKNEDYTKNFFFISLYFDEIGKLNLKKYTEGNIGKKIFIANQSEMLLYPKISVPLFRGLVLNGNLFEENWQELYETVKFEVFKNSIKIN